MITHNTIGIPRLYCLELQTSSRKISFAKECTENLLTSCEKYANLSEKGVDLIINGGDLMDSNLIKADEGSAVAKALSYSTGIKEYYLLGNHEKLDDAGKFHSLALLDRDHIEVVIFLVYM